MSRQPDFSSEVRPRRRAWERASVGLGVLAVVFVAFEAARARSDVREARARLSDTRRQLADQGLRLRALEARSPAPSRPADTPPPSRLVAAIGAVLPPDARLERLAIDYDKGVALELSVLTRSATVWDLFLDRLERSPDFRQVEPGPESRQGEVQSVVRARWAGAR